MHALQKLRRAGQGLAAAAVIVTLASCGGHDDGAPVPAVADTNMPPASASATVGGFIAYLKVLTATAPETTSPLDLTGFVAPTDDIGAFDTSI